uniref:Uncharacterized protein n=1 Tax=Anguilla anguilla TaxID=7936 RepID=A0A0E9TNV1_ANGAN
MQFTTLRHAVFPTITCTVTMQKSTWSH